MNKTEFIRLVHANRFKQDEFIASLSRHLPEDIRRQLEVDAQPDISFQDRVSIDDIVRPLGAGAFLPDCDKRSHALYSLIQILEYVVHGYDDFNSTTHNSYKRIYIASFYLYASHYGSARCLAFVPACSAIIDASRHVDIETKLNLIDFFAFLSLACSSENYLAASNLMHPSLLLSVVTSITGQMLVELEDMVLLASQYEHFIRTWSRCNKAPKVGSPDPDFEGAKNILSSLLETCGPSGKLAQRCQLLNEACK